MTYERLIEQDEWLLLEPASEGHVFKNREDQRGSKK
jgi:hypothetical protein